MAGIAIPAGGITLTTVGGTLIPAIGGATIASGAGVYFDNTDSNELKVVNVTAAASARAAGFLYQGTTDGGGALIVPNGFVIGGWAGLTAWTWYAFDTGGSLTDAPATDLAGGEYVTWAGFSVSTTEIYVNVVVTNDTI